MTIENRRKNSCDHVPSCALAETLSEQAADRAVKKAFAVIGIDVDDQKSVDEFKANVQVLGKLRKITEHSMLAFFGALAVAFAAAIWAAISGFVSKFH